MTCREFKHGAAELTLWELTRSGDRKLISHSEKCEACSGWLQKQQALAVSMQTLQARTAGLEAGPDVERALLRAFRQDTRQGTDPRPQQLQERTLSGGPDPVFSEVRKRSGSSGPAVTPLSTPMALHLSRAFEVGAYVAIAAALLVGVFLGLRLLQHSSNPAPVQSQIAPATTAPAVQSANAAQSSGAAGPVGKAEAIAVKAPPRRTMLQPVTAKASSEDSDTLANAGYTDLMFCDPLSCAADTQVVRMELPATGQGSQPQVADLVVGYDGVVRAVRMVN